MQGYYSSMGGGNLNVNNRTSRMRIYPRMRNQKRCEHLTLTSQDVNPEFKIIPGKEYKIQLVAFNDLIQFIVNEKVVYELQHGMNATATTDNKSFYGISYTPEMYAIYKEGYFGFRMTHSFHKYYDFKVYKLN